MTKKIEDSGVSKGALIGGLVGIGALTCFLALRSKKGEALSSIGDTLSHVGHILEDHDIQEPEMVQNFSKKLHKHENTVGQVVDWVATGINLWNKFNKG